MKNLKLLFLATIIFASYSLSAQVAVSTDGSSAEESAMLEVKSSDKGMLIPRVALTGVNDASTIATPATSLLIYNTATATGVSPGYYYNSGSSGTPVWERFTTGIIDGSETKVSAGTNVSVTGTGTTASPYVVNATGATTLTIGQSYQGGKIFWLDATGQHGLIAATADQSTGIRWNKDGSNPGTNAVRDGVGAGKFNTERIIAIQGTGAAYAAQICANYQGGDYGDWYLPSKYELYLLNQQKTAVGGLSSYYWSSNESESDITEAWVQFFSDYGAQGVNLKNWYNRVRAVRAF